MISVSALVNRHGSAISGSAMLPSELAEVVPEFSPRMVVLGVSVFIAGG